MRTLVHIKLDDYVKQQAQNLADELGFSLSALINAQLKQFIRTKKIIFTVFPDEQMSVELEKELAKIEKDIKQHKNLSRPLSSTQEIAKFFRTL